MGDVPQANQPSGNYGPNPSSSGSRTSKDVSSRALESQSHDLRHDHNVYAHGAGSHSAQPPFPQQSYQPQYRSGPQQPLHPGMSQHIGPGRGSPLDLSPLGNALPNVGYSQTFGPQITSVQASRSQGQALNYQFQQGGQYATQAMSNMPPGSPYGLQYSPQQYHSMYGPQQQPGVAPPNPQFFPTQQYMTVQAQQTPQYFYPSTQFASQAGTFSGNVFPTAQFPGRPPVPREVGFLRPHGQDNPADPSASVEPGRRKSGTGPVTSPPSVPKGPPRKPKQSGHALWVGNLPPGATVIDLKEHFSRNATMDILSVFLISKSNCAFVNYKTEETCAAAMTRFHESRFNAVRLVCRLRRSSVNTVSGIPTGPAALTAAGGLAPTTTQPDTKQKAQATEAGPVARQGDAKEKFFIVKSLTLEDLELSVQNGIWATQSHNEEALNKAYETADAVFLIFSANKSGEYFGYAKMTSPINDDPAAAIEFAPKAQAIDDSDLPKAIPTEATEFAPAGRIIDDSARGTIFWEAETDAAEGQSDATAGDAIEDPGEVSDTDGDATSPAPQAWGKPFTLEWLSTTRLPFYRTRGLRNPWNSNREVKIARDGTELEPSVGRQLLQMFHGELSPSPISPAVVGGGGPFMY